MATLRNRKTDRYHPTPFGSALSWIGLAAVLALGGCSESPLGPTIEGRDYDTDTASGVDGGAQPDDTAGGADGGDTVVTDTATASLSCTESTTQNVWYPGATVVQTVTCGASVTAATEVSDSWPSWLSLTSTLPVTAVSFGGTAGAAATTDWIARFNDQANVTVRAKVLGTTPTYSQTTAATLTDNVVSSLTATAVLDTEYDGSGGILKPLLSNAVAPSSSSNGTAPWATSDIPRLTYTDGDCSAATSPYVCVTAGSAATSPTATLDVKWDFGPFDQGYYELNTLGYISVDGAKVYTAADDSVLTVANPGGEQGLIGAGSQGAAGRSTYFSAANWDYYLPQLALTDYISDRDKQVWAVVFPALNSQHNQYAGLVKVDRAVDAANLVTTWFDYDANSKLSANADTQSMAIAATAATDEEWLSLGGHNAVSGGYDLVLNVVDWQSGTPAAVPTSVNLTGLGDTSVFNSVAITPAFDDAGTSRHGIAFFANWVPTGSQTLYVSKIRSLPATEDEAGFFDASSWYKTAGNDIDAVVKSVPVTGDTNATLSLVRMTYAEESGTDYLYVGWRDSTTNAVQFARIDANASGNNPTVNSTTGGDELTSMASSVRGRPTYAIAAGRNSAGSAILGVFFSSTASTGCNFQAYQVSGGSLARLGTTQAVGSSTDCRYAHLWWNAATSKFMAVYLDQTSFDTYYTEFGFNSTADDLVPVSPDQVLVTDRASAPCNLSAQYSPTWHRIGMVSMHGACTVSGAHNMYFDVIKTGR